MEPVEYGQCYYYVPRVGARGGKVAGEYVGCDEIAAWVRTIAGRRVEACETHRRFLDRDVLPADQFARSAR